MFLKNKNIIFKIRISKVTDYAALIQYKLSIHVITLWHRSVRLAISHALPPSLTRVFAVHSAGNYGPKFFFMRTANTLIRLS